MADNLISDKDKAYTAGFLDADGCITIVRTTYAETPRPFHYVTISASNTSKEIIDWLAATWGGGVCNKGRRKRNANAKPIFEVQWKHDRAGQILELLYPYLRLKRRQAEICLLLHWEKRRRIWTSQRLNSQQQEYRERLHGEIKKLNKKGDVWPSL